MKLFLAFFFILILDNINAQNKDCNYISDYYPLVYSAQIDFLKKNYDSAYNKLKKAENKCNLRFSGDTNEISILAELENRLKNYDETILYLTKLVENGYPFKYIEEDSIYTDIKNTTNWTNLKNKSDEIFQNWKSSLNLELRKELILMNEEDQRVRTTNKDELIKVDSINELKLKNILYEYGYPNNEVIGNWFVDEKIADIHTLIMHINDIEYFEPLFLEYVNTGKADPTIYASLIDSYNRKRSVFTYRIYSNLKDEQIDDIKNLDNRRISIGLRPWKMQLQYEQLRGY